MGQQQLFLIVLSVIVVAGAVAVGMAIFRGNAVESNRRAVIADLITYGSKAQRYFRVSKAFGGGNRNFDRFYLAPIDTGNGNGSYSITTNIPSGATFISGSDTYVSGSRGRIYIIGCGKEIGSDDDNPVKAFIEVTADSIKSTILN